MQLLDLFCGAGGAAMGYHRAGFVVTGVDIKRQPNYPFAFVQADALEYLQDNWHKYDVIHASPPCQAFTAYRRKGYGVGDNYPDLIPHVRKLLTDTGRPYMIENVEQARHRLVDPVRLCGSMFGLDVQRHRMFELNFDIKSLQCDHSVWTPRFPPATNRTNLRKTVEVGVWRIPLTIQQEAMGIDWMTLKELSESIPPAYTEHLGKQLMEYLRRNDADS